MNGPFERAVNESAAGDPLEFASSADAERYIRSSPELRKASAFSWWKGSGAGWGIAVTGKTGRLSFITMSGGDYVVGIVPLSHFQG